MTLTVEYTGNLDTSADDSIIGAAITGLQSCQLNSTYWEDDSMRRFKFQVADESSANAMLLRIQQAGVTLSRHEVSE